MIIDDNNGIFMGVVKSNWMVFLISIPISWLQLIGCRLLRRTPDAVEPHTE